MLNSKQVFGKEGKQMDGKCSYEYAKLRGRIVEKFGTLCAFAEKLGISNVCMSKKLNGKIGFSQQDIEEWAKELEIPKSEYIDYFFA